ncbi:MAG: YCII-related protein, partial [Microbacterium sp.]|nr:YCII-related protein [Microbacterium sp.]
DGPFAELKEVLASFAILECSSIERAREIVAEMVAVLGEPMEIRPIMGDDFA